ncbi:MAG: trypsin-like peptidase domain-containing protein [Clostridia bacterium]|nr:trypsin-like peptidase domain-containing protein [Clostridia bacterium]
MNNENNFDFNSENNTYTYSPSNFNYSSDNSFKKSKSSKNSSSSFGKTVIVPFISGIVGATLVVGTCFGVPSIKTKLIGSSTTETSSKIFSSASNEATNLVNLSDYSNTSIAVAEKVLPSVVGITVTYQISSLFGGSSTGEATGSGIIVSEDGYIVTNNHVISSESNSSFYAITEATGIKVNLYNDTTSYEAKVIGTDVYTDLAVLKIEKTGLTAAQIGNSDQVKVGEFVMAVGNPLGMDYSVTSGIVSALDREISSDDGTTFTAIQTDAAINSGNSGGALVNSNGELIGINTMKYAGTGIEGIGFAIPISSATNIIEQLIEFQAVKRPYIGISASAVDSNISKRYHIPEGIYVETVEENSAAEKAGLQVSDIITKIEGQEVKSVSELNKIKYTYKIGDTVKLTVYRNGSEIEVPVVLSEQPEIKSEAPTSQQPQSNPIEGNLFDFFR